MKTDYKRIYCVVATTVQNPFLFGSKSSATIVQPLGRQVAQAAHVVSKVRFIMLRKAFIKLLKGRSIAALRLAISTLLFTPVTTIILEARDSYELKHVFNLLEKNNIPVYDFFDTEQPDYGSPEDSVRTAIATEPVEPEAVKGILDYLPLWGSQYTK